jgi:hypothetical protein
MFLSARRAGPNDALSELRPQSLLPFNLQVWQTALAAKAKLTPVVAHQALSLNVQPAAPTCLINKVW